MKLTLDLEPDDSELNDIALILFHTSAPNYTFADDLNRLYDLTLARDEDLPLPLLSSSDLLPCPHFACNDPFRRLSFHLLERPLPPHSSPSPATPPAAFWPSLHKLLIIQGELAPQAEQNILTDFQTAPVPPTDPYDLSATARYNILLTLQQNFIPLSHLTPLLSPLPPTASAKARRESKEMQLLIATILDFLDASAL